MSSPVVPLGRRERGAALVMAILVLLVLSLLAMALINSIKMDSKLTGHSTRDIEALNFAEAGVAEAMARLRSGEVPDTLNPKMVAQIFLTVPGSVPVLGADSVALATAQASGKWLAYSTATPGSQVLTVRYKTDPTQTVIYKYDSGQNPAIQTTSGMPIFQITSTGRSGPDSRTIVTEVVRKAVNPSLLAGIAVNSSTTKLWCGAATHGPFMYNGMNHRADTPTGAGVWGPDPANYAGWGDMPAMWTNTTITYGGNHGTVCCDPAGTPGPFLENQPAGVFYAGPWTALGMPQADFYDWIGPAKATMPAAITGINYLDNDAIKQNRNGSWSLSNANGEGFLYADGDVTVNGDVTWRGLIYTEGQLVVKGNIWLLGGLVVADPGTFEVAHKQCTFLFSRDAITQAIGRYRDQFVTLSYREQ